jgi:hypothetical protein
MSRQGQQGQQGKQGQQGQSASSSGQSSSGQSGRAGQAGNPQADSQQSGDQSQAANSRQQAAQQALDRLRQANQDMRRAASQGTASAADSRRAADRLREATDLLGGAQQQDAAGRLGSMAQAADQLAAEQKKQADHVRDLMAQQNAARAGGQPPKFPTAQELDKMVNDRQQVSDELSRLTQQIRGAARELAPTQPGASNKLRGAIESMDENDLGTRLQRSSDQLRSGQFSDPAETALTNDLQKLGQQVNDAARALGRSQPSSKDAELSRAMDQLSRLRDQLGGLGGRQNPQTGQAGQGGQPGQQQAQNGQGKQGQGGQKGGGQGKGGQGGQGDQPGQGNGQPQAGGQGGGRQGGDVGNRIAGATGNPGGNNRDGAFGAYDTGNSRISGRAVTPQQGPNPADTQQLIDQGVNLLNQVRSAVQDSPEAKQELQKLIDEMRSLDPSRFPGNPALVEQMHQQLVSSVDALELQLRRQMDEGRGGTIRNADPTKVPPGYEDSVAEYYRKLSSAGH